MGRRVKKLLIAFFTNRLYLLRAPLPCHRGLRLIDLLPPAPGQAATLSPQLLSPLEVEIDLPRRPLRQAEVERGQVQGSIEAGEAGDLERRNTTFIMMAQWKMMSCYKYHFLLVEGLDVLFFT